MTAPPPVERSFFRGLLIGLGLALPWWTLAGLLWWFWVRP